MKSKLTRVTLLRTQGLAVYSSLVNVNLKKKTCLSFIRLWQRAQSKQFTPFFLVLVKYFIQKRHIMEVKWVENGLVDFLSLLKKSFLSKMCYYSIPCKVITKAQSKGLKKILKKKRVLLPLNNLYGLFFKLLKSIWKKWHYLLSYTLMISFAHFHNLSPNCDNLHNPINSHLFFMVKYCFFQIHVTLWKKNGFEMCVDLKKKNLIQNIPMLLLNSLQTDLKRPSHHSTNIKNI